MKNWAKIILLSFCIIFLSCCRCCDCCWGNTTVTYRVSGPGSSSSVSVMFNNDFGDPVQFSSVQLPWVYTFTIKERGDYYFGGDYDGYFPAHISARRSTYTGSLTVTIHVNGKLVASAYSTPERRTAEARYNVKF